MQVVLNLIIIVTISAMIGWVTNYIAIKLLFKPYNPVRVLFFTVQGVIPKRRDEIARRIAETIDRDLISIKDITTTIDSMELEIEIEKIVNSIVDEKLKKEFIDKMPMLAMFINDSILDKIKQYIKDVIEENKSELVNIIIHKLEAEVDFKELVIKKIKEFSLEEVEKMTINIAKRELKHIELIGAVLGAMIGIVQFLIIQFM